MWHWFTALSQDNQLKVAALLGASVAFVIGLLQYQKSQRWSARSGWRRKMQSFFRRSIVNLALQMMDWGEDVLSCFQIVRPIQAIRGLGDDDLARALAVHPDRPEGFTEAEAALRDLFDHFLDRLERINSFVEGRLVSLRDIRPYLDYWADKVVRARAGDRAVIGSFSSNDIYASMSFLAWKSCSRGFADMSFHQNRNALPSNCRRYYRSWRLMSFGTRAKFRSALLPRSGLQGSNAPDRFRDADQQSGATGGNGLGGVCGSVTFARRPHR